MSIEQSKGSSDRGGKIVATHAGTKLEDALEWLDRYFSAKPGTKVIIEVGEAVGHEYLGRRVHMWIDGYSVLVSPKNARAIAESIEEGYGNKLSKWGRDLAENLRKVAKQAEINLI